MAENRYEYWQKALALTGGKRAITRDEMKALGLIDEPGAGFFRRRTMRAGPFVPVAIWYDGDTPLATVNGKAADAGEVWSYCCPHPVSEAAFRAVEAGGSWPDEDVAVTASYEAPAAPDGIGANNPPDEDEAAALKRQIEAQAENAKAYATIKDDDTASKAQSARSRLLDLSGQADKRREALKAPHLAAGRLVDDTYNPLVKAGKAAADTIRAALGAWETEKSRKAEAARLAAEETARKEADRLAAEAKKNAKKGLPPPEPAPPPPEPEPAPAPQAQIRGAGGRAAAVVEVRIAKVVDQDAAYQSLRTHPEMVALIAALAQRAVKAGVEVKGVEIETRKDVR